MPALGELDSAGAILAAHQLGAEGEVEWVGRRASGGRSLVVPVQPAGLADLDHFADLRRLNRAVYRAVLLQGLVAAPAVIVGEVVLEDSSQVPLAECAFRTIVNAQIGPS